MLTQHDASRQIATFNTLEASCQKKCESVDFTLFEVGIRAILTWRHQLALNPLLQVCELRVAENTGVHCEAAELDEDEPEDYVLRPDSAAGFFLFNNVERTSIDRLSS
jgi:hypothetical protein